MQKFWQLTAAVLTAGALIAAPGWAQQSDDATNDTAPTVGEDTGESTDQPTETETTEDGIGSTYIDSEFGDWQLRCVRTESGDDPCQMYQLLLDDQENPVSEITVFAVDPGQRAAAGATVITPLETLLTRGIQISVDGSAPRTYAFSFCRTIGCFARIGLEQENLDEFKRGAVATLTMVPAAAVDQEVVLTISLTGFTAAFDAMTGG